MVWNEHHDLAFVREILAVQPWRHRLGSSERGQSWDEIAAILNSLPEPSFRQLTQRAVRDRYNLISNKDKISKENRESGISPEPSELDDALAEAIQLFSEAEASREQNNQMKKAKAEQELEKAQEIRRQSVETYAETKKRRKLEEDDEDGPSSKRRRSSTSTSEMIDFLRQKNEQEANLRREEMRLKEKQIDIQVANLNILQQQNLALMQLLGAQQQGQANVGKENLQNEL